MIASRYGPLARRVTRATVAAAALAGAPAALDAQALTLLRAFQPPLTAACGAPAAPTAPRAAAPDAARRAEAARLGATADEHLLAGELPQARDVLRRATALHPTSAELAFRLARTYEELGEDRAAVDAYCLARTLDLPPTERTEADERLQALAIRLGAVPTDAATRSFEAGITRYESGDVTGAEAAFSAAIAAAPGLAAAYHDRALARIRGGQAAGALADLDTYARLAPGAMTPALRDAREVLRRGRYSPGVAAAAGLFPGGAQMYTGRPLRGAALAAIAVAGAYLAFDGETVAVERTGVDPFGNEYTYLDPTGGTRYKNRALGTTMFSMSLIGGLAEGYFHARAGRVDVLRLMRAVAGAARTAASGDP